MLLVFKVIMLLIFWFVNANLKIGRIELDVFKLTLFIIALYHTIN
jgi:hypothetical protein